jgi:hypothetical protein
LLDVLRQTLRQGFCRPVLGPDEQRQLHGALPDKELLDGSASGTILPNTKCWSLSRN